MNSRTIVTIIAIVLCLVIIAGLFGIVASRNRRDAAYAVQMNSGENQNSAINMVHSDNADGQNSAINMDRSDNEENSDAEDTGTETEEEDASDTGEAEEAPAAQPVETGDLSASGSFYQKLADSEDISILVVGDSIGHGTGASDSKHIWYNLLANNWEGTYGCTCSVTDLAVNGNTAYGAYALLEQAAAENSDADYDLVIVCDAQNDEDSDFALYYEVLLRSIYRHYPDSTVLAVLESSQREVTEKIQTVMDLADHYGILTVDTIEPFAENYDSLCADGIHPNDNGQALYAQAVEDAVLAALAEGRAADNAGADPMDESVSDYDETRWYGADDFEPGDSDTTLEATIGDAGQLSIVYGFGSGEDSTVIYLDDTPHTVSPYIIAPTVAVLADKDVSVDFDCRIEFGDTEQMEAFRGVLFSS